MPKLIKFCYFIIALLVVSCADGTREKSAEKKSSETPTETTAQTDTSNKTILLFGDSLTAGYGLDDVNDAYPGVLQQTIDSLDLGYTVINSGVSGETTAGGKSRIEWVIKQTPDIFILELGANDGLRGVSISETRSNLQAIIDIVKANSPKTKVVLAGMQLPPNMGQDYTSQFKQLFVEVAKNNDLLFIPFILKDVGGIAELNQNDGIHPNKRGHKILANTVWETIKPLVVR
ncbi:MAG: arylesterase [Aquaticitalea sp.]